MRAPLLLAALAACTPEITSGSYLCGPDAACPEGQVCNGPDNVCVSPTNAEAFACEAGTDFEPDNTATDAHEILNLGCVSAPFRNENCMLEGDEADWVKFAAPTGCIAVEVEARLGFPVAFEQLGLELWDLDANQMLATEGPCTQGAQIGEERRCLDFVLQGGKNYGIKVHPTGEGTCAGMCSYNRYTLQVQLLTPG